MPRASVKLQQAVTFHQAGRVGRAEALYEEVLREQPCNVIALHMLGLCAAQNKDFGRSVELIGQAVAIDPGNAIAYNNRGLSLQELRQWAAALADFDHAIAAQPAYAKAHYNRGCVLRQLRRLDAALGSYERAASLQPGYAEAYVGSGSVLHELGRFDESLENYQRAVDIKPNFAEAWFGRGVLLKRLGRLDESLRSYDRAVALKMDYAEAYFNRGNLLHELNRLDAALASFERALAIDARYAEAHANRAVVLQERNRWNEALASLERALALKPAYAEAHVNRGVVLHELQRLDEALASYDEAIAVKPGYPEAHFYKSLTLLLAGDFDQGWIEYEWRDACTGGAIGQSERQFEQPPWAGATSLVGKTILLHSEQGLGDTIQFCRYAPLVAELGARVILEVQRPVKGLLASLAGVNQVIARGESPPPFDHHCSLMSLPRALRTTLLTIPARVPYLEASTDKRNFWKERLGEKRRPRVGLVWSGGFRPDQPRLWPVNSRRNVPLAKLAPLAHPDIEFISLQKGAAAEAELSELIAARWDGPPVAVFSNLLNDFSDTAALIEQLDLVISVDTSTAHLAGALGKPVWILNRFDTCWRWLLDRADSPWYPAARLYRQETPLDWDGVVRRVRADLLREIA